MKFFSAYDRPPRLTIEIMEPTMTQQHFKEECDINSILKKYIRTGILENYGPGAYGDVFDANDYRESLHIIMEAEETFNGLPSNIRKRFGNDPAAYLDFVYDPANKEEGIKLGLFTPNATLVPPNSSNSAQNGEPKKEG